MIIIPVQARQTLTDQLDSHARTAWSERCARVDARFRGEYAYTDAFESNPWFGPNATEEEKRTNSADPNQAVPVSLDRGPGLVGIRLLQV